MTATEAADPVRVAQRTALATLAEFAVTIKVTPLRTGLKARVSWVERERRNRAVEVRVTTGGLKREGTGALLKPLVAEVTAANERVGRAVWAALIYGLGEGTEKAEAGTGERDGGAA